MTAPKPAKPRPIQTDAQLVEYAKKLFDAIGAQEPRHNVNWEIGLAVSQWLEDYERSRKIVSQEEA